MHKLFLLILLIGLPYSNNLFAQEKFEKESRIKQRDVPSKALLFMDSLKYKAKMKWYEEEGLTRKSIEAKFKHNRTKYSIEFDTLGNVEDIEIEVNWQDIESDITDPVFNQFKLDCSKYKIVKVQKQFTGSENELFSLLINGTNGEQPKIKYEIIVRCNQQKEVNLFEYLFNNKGILIAKSKIVFKNSSHLEY
jgi:hypothetical protein